MRIKWLRYQNTCFIYRFSKYTCPSKYKGENQKKEFVISKLVKTLYSNRVSLTKLRRKRTLPWYCRFHPYTAVLRVLSVLPTFA